MAKVDQHPGQQLRTVYRMSILSKVRRSPRAKTGGSERPAAVADQRIVKSGNVGRNWLDRQHLDFTRIRDFGHFAQLCGHGANMTLLLPKCGIRALWPIFVPIWNPARGWLCPA